MPQRIQRRRTAGWRMPEGTVYVGRPSRWGNWWAVGDGFEITHEPALDPAKNGGRVLGPSELIVSAIVRTPEVAVALYRAWLDGEEETVRRELAGRDLACWCPLDQACHADVLLDIANSEVPGV